MNWESLREHFPVTRNFNFQNHAAVAPLCKPAADAVQRYLAATSQNGYVDGGFYKHVEKARQSAARLINANPDEVTFIKNTTEGLNFVANGLTWKKGDNVVTARAEFPSNLYPWLNLESRGVRVRTVVEEGGRIPIDSLIDAIDSRTRLVAISSVQFASGYRTDLATLGEHCVNKGVFLCADAIQSLGVMPIDVKGMHIDFLASGAHKWLCGPEGIGIFYVSKELQGHLHPSCVGWASVKNPLDFDRSRFDFDDSIKRFDSGTFNMPGIFGLGGSLEMLLDIGIDKICKRVLFLTDRLADGVRDKGYRVFSSRERPEASSVLAFSSDVHDHSAIQRHLQSEHRLVIAVRRDKLRASPHFYNTEKEIDQLIDLLPRH